MLPFDGAEEERRIIDEYNDRFKPRPYRQVFYPPSSGRWRVDALFPEGFFEASRILLNGLIDGSLRESIEGVAAIFLARHFLELMLKYTLYHSRWLLDETHNAKSEEIEVVGTGHKLTPWWTLLRGELKKTPTIGKGLDFEFVEQFVVEFDSVDPKNVVFRYPGHQLPVEELASEELKVSYGALLYNLERVNAVMTSLDSALVEQFGLNIDWQSELDGY